MTNSGILSLREFLCLPGILVNFADSKSFSWKHSKHLIHRMSSVGLMLGCPPEGENSDLKFRLSLRNTHLKLMLKMLQIWITASVQDLCHCQCFCSLLLWAGHKYLGQGLWPQEFKKEEISESILFVWHYCFHTG